MELSTHLWADTSEVAELKVANNNNAATGEFLNGDVFSKSAAEEKS